ncbi:hypothetical protein LTR17_019859 [Elasticomyces elasticus]|nr:hypothetical protein LTR17_019859 [Elasticomyces elasticus]
MLGRKQPTGGCLGDIEEERIIVSCNYDVSELTISCGARLRTFNPPRGSIPAEGDGQAAAIRDFVYDQLDLQVVKGKEIALHWVVPLMTPDSHKMSRRDASISAGFSSKSRILSQVEAIGSTSLFRGNQKSGDSGRLCPPQSRITQDLLVAQSTPPPDCARDDSINMLIVLCNDSGCEMAAYTLVTETGSHKEIALSRAVSAGWNELGTSLRRWLSQHFGERFGTLDPRLTTANGVFMNAFERYVSGLSESTTDWAQGRLALEMHDVHDDAYDRHHGSVILSKDSLVTVGAIIREVQDLKATSTKALRHYGCVYGMPFREGIDPPSKAYLEPYLQMKVCNHRVEWLIRKGQDITPHTVAASKNTQICNPSDLAPFIELRFVSCVLQCPPQWSDSPGVENATGIIRTEFTPEEVRQRFTLRNGRYALGSVVKLSLGNHAGVLQAERVEQKSGLAMGTTTIRFE